MKMLIDRGRLLEQLWNLQKSVWGPGAYIFSKEWRIEKTRGFFGGGAFIYLFFFSISILFYFF